MRALLFCLLTATSSFSQQVTDLWLRGYSVIPTPQTVKLESGEVVLGAGWTIDPGKVNPQNIAVRTLRQDAAEFHGLNIGVKSGAGKVIRLAVTPGAVATKADPQIDKQAYRLLAGDGVIEITGNGEPGLFYGVQTLLQLMKRDAAGRLVIPKGSIEDWPAMQLRFLHWDTKHHQDRMETLKRYLDWAARFKANMIAFELEDKFEYPSHPVIGAPGAFTTAELQEIVNYGLERHIQVVPNVQAPAHLAYVLKHPGFAHLKADGNNYQSDLCDPRTYELIFSMYDDVIKATKGIDYFYVSTDEVYYAGINGRCTAPYNDENRSLKWVEFVKRAHEHLSKQGRRMLIWMEYPLLPEHVKMLPADIIDGVIGEEEYLETENKMGMRQLGYVSMQGAEYLFPNHLNRQSRDGVARGHLDGAFQSLAAGRYRRGNPIGVFGAAWGDSGLHNETFWLGWSAVAQWGWNPGTARPAQHAAEFMRLYYGPRAEGMLEVYRSMQNQASSWQATWDRVVSRVRAPGYGNSYGKGIGTTRRDETLSLPPLPQAGDLRIEPSFAKKYEKFLAEARGRMLENEQLQTAIQAEFGLADRNHYNLEVLLGLTRFIGHHWRLLDGMDRAEKAIEQARDSHQKKEYAEAVGHLVEAFNRVDGARREGIRTFGELRAVFEKSQFPKGRAVGGRKFVHVLDDTKDHWADRRPDLSYMSAPEESIGMEEWLKSLRSITEAYAKQHNVPVRGIADARLEE